MIDLADIKAAVASAVRAELRRAEKKLLTPGEVARIYRTRRTIVHDAAERGEVKCKEGKPRNGGRTFLIDAIDAERIWGAH